MALLSDKNTIQVLGILTVLICLKFFIIILASGGKRKRAPEDGFQPLKNKEPLLENASGASPTESSAETFSEEERWKRIVQNDLENIPITVLLMWIAVICGGDNLTNVILAALFLFGRVMHSVCYIKQLMPWRSIGWLFGIIATLGFMANIIYG